MAKQTNLTYSSSILDERLGFNLIDRVPSMVFDCERDLDELCHHVLYRPALLNGRHIVDVLRAVCGPADVSEAELDRVRSEATKEASEVEEGVWETL